MTLANWADEVLIIDDYQMPLLHIGRGYMETIKNYIVNAIPISPKNEV